MRPLRLAKQAVKRVIYRRGRPYDLAGRQLRFWHETMPERLDEAAASGNWVRRNGALQLRALLDLLRRGDFAVDVGANAGVVSVIMASLCGHEGSVVAYEPNTALAGVFARNFRLNPGLKAPRLVHCALSDRPGEISFYLGAGHEYGSMARSAAQNGVEHKVRAVRLDDELDGLPTPRLVKIDTEGAEIRVLKGAPKLLASDAEILCELHPYAWGELGHTKEELVDLVESSGRRIAYLDNGEDLSRRARYGIVRLAHA